MIRETALPKKLWVGSYEFPLRQIEPDDVVLGGDDGLMEPAETNRGIYIANNLDRRKTLEIILHEITHAINFVNDIDDGEDEETVATKHGIAWSMFLLDNPRFQRWLTYTLNKIRKERADA